MSEHQPGRQPDEAAQGSAPAQPDSQLRLVTEEESAVFADDLAASDESPTIISKNPPAQATATAIKATTPETLLGSLRGRKLAHFELIEPIGVGGMAAVLRARDTQLDRSVALKILPPDMARDDENISRFRREAQAAAKLDHENIARVFYCGEDQKLHFIAFEYVEGENLRSILEKRGRLEVGEAVRYILQIATALEHAAARGVVHRDVKPSNIIITPTGRAKLVDMGLARNVEPQTNQLTQSGMTLGTFDYISPEQALEPREADARSDIYSLGCTFYHMVTGQPPVPEGTAAKKLHHHQHVPPLDPRQLNPDIPDEVALIIGKMMMKNPKDRYQRPVQLVQHLMQVAQKVGAGADVPEGALFIDAPLLSEPRKRPLLMVSLAALALAAVLMALNLAPPNRQTGSGPRSPGRDDKPAKDSVAASPKQSGVNPPSAAAGGVMEIASQEDLKLLLENQTSRELKGIVAKDFSITEPNLVFQGGRTRKLTLKGKLDNFGRQQQPIITWKWQPLESGEPAAALTIDDGVAVFSNLCFAIDGGGGTPDQSAGAVAVRGVSSASFYKCSFQQSKVANLQFTRFRDLVPLASVLVLPAAKGERPQLEFDQCLFYHDSSVDGGQVAVGLHAPAEVKALNCAFMSHGAQFHLRGDGQSKITLVHCDALVVAGPVFRLDDQASCQLEIDHSIISSPENIVSGRDLHLIHQTDAKEPKITFSGAWKRNCYDHLNAMWVWPTESGADRIIATQDEFRREISKYGGKDNASVEVPESAKIWKNAAPQTQPPVEAFLLDPTAREVRTADGKGVLGIERCAWGEMAKLEPLKDEPRYAALNLKDNEKLVDPTLDGKAPFGVYKSVFQALHAAEPGDVIYIKEGKVKGRPQEIEVDMTLLKKPGLRVTLRPFEGEHPILTLGKVTERESYFFRLLDGEMTFEQLEIVLEPDEPGLKTQTLALLDGNAACTFRNCVLTLKQNEKVNSKGVPLSVITLSDIDEAMMMGMKSTRTSPEVVFENCFIRGEGDAVSIRAGRPLDLRLDNTLVGLTGSLVNVLGGKKETTVDTFVKVNLQKSSIFTTKPLLACEQGLHPKGLPPLRDSSAKGCLFTALESKPLVVLDYPDLSDATLRSCFDWKDGGNAYSGFDKLLENSASDYRLNYQGWKDNFCKDADPVWVRANFNLALPPQKLWLASPDDFKPRGEFQTQLQSFGATLDSEMPLPQSKGKSE